MKKCIVTVVVLFTAFSMLSCDGQPSEDTADDRMRKQTAQAMKEVNAQVGMPAIVNFQERKLAKMIFELRDQEKLITYAYIVNHLTGELVFIGKCVGFGLPYSVQYTNPEKAVDLAGNRASRYHFGTLPQADPNGLFMPQGLSATWLMMVDPNGGTPRPVYVEPEILVSPFPLHRIANPKQTKQ